MLALVPWCDLRGQWLPVPSETDFCLTSYSNSLLYETYWNETYWKSWEAVICTISDENNPRISSFTRKFQDFELIVIFTQSTSKLIYIQISGFYKLMHLWRIFDFKILHSNVIWSLTGYFHGFKALSEQFLCSR